MAERDVFILAERALADVIDRSRPDQWDAAQAGVVPQRRASPTRHCATSSTTTRTTSAWVPDTLAGTTIAEVGDRHEHLKTAASPEYRVHSDAAIAAAQALDDPERPVHLSYGEFPAAEYLRHATSFRGFRVFDIGRWIGAGTEMPPELVQGMWDVLSPDMEAWRAIGVYRAAVPVPDDAPLQDRLLGLSGRDPHPKDR